MTTETDTRPSRSKLVTWLMTVVALAVSAALQVLIYGAPHLLRFGRYQGWAFAVALPAFFLLPFLVLLALLKPVRALHPGKRSPVLLLVCLAIVAAYIGVCAAFNLFGT